MAERTPTEEKVELKNRIRALKTRRDDAISRKAPKETASLRRGLRALKKRIRIVAQAAKAQAASAAAAAAAAPKEGATA
jgi:protein-arginine kinase activator protein McsA